MTVYLSGLISNGGRITDEKEIERNVISTRSVVYGLWHLGFSVFWPHANDGGAYRYMIGQGIAPRVAYERLIEFDLKVLRSGVCGAIYMMPGWTRSEGASKEYNVAKEMQLQVFFTMKQAIQWRKLCRM